MHACLYDYPFADSCDPIARDGVDPDLDLIAGAELSAERSRSLHCRDVDASGPCDDVRDAYALLPEEFRDDVFIIATLYREDKRILDYIRPSIFRDREKVKEFIVEDVDIYDRLSSDMQSDFYHLIASTR